MSNYIPKTLWGWTGIVALVLTIVNARRLGWLGWAIGLGVFYYGYIVKDANS